jgi:hypothetical protein
MNCCDVVKFHNHLCLSIEKQYVNKCTDAHYEHTIDIMTLWTGLSVSREMWLGQAAGYMTTSDSPQLYLPAQNEYVPTGGPPTRRDLPLDEEIERYFGGLDSVLEDKVMGTGSDQPITVAARSTAWTVFACWNTGIVGSNPTEGIDVCVRIFCVCAVLWADSDPATGWSPVWGVLPNV